MSSVTYVNYNFVFDKRFTVMDNVKLYPMFKMLYTEQEYGANCS
jgi:hypothetical protein